MTKTAIARYGFETLAALALCISFAIWEMGDVLFLVVVSVAVVLFSLRFGIGFSVCAVLLTVLVAVLRLYTGDGQVLMNRDTIAVFVRLLTMNAFALLLGILVRKAYEAMQTQSVILQEKNKELVQELDVLEKKNRALQHEMHKLEALHRIEAIFYEKDLEKLTDDIIRTLHREFNIDQLAMYCVNAPKQQLRLKVRQGYWKTLPNIIRMEEAKSFYERLFISRKLTIGNDGDDPGAPMMAIPICRNDEVKRVIVIQKMKTYRDYETEMLHWILHKMKEKYEEAFRKSHKNNEDFHPQTSVYRLSAFAVRVEEEKRRERMFNQPYSCMGLYIRELHLPRLPQLQMLLHEYFHDPNAVAYDEKTRMLYVLLPGYGQEAIGPIRRELEERLKEGHMYVVNWAMLQNEFAV